MRICSLGIPKTASTYCHSLFKGLEERRHYTCGQSLDTEGIDRPVDKFWGVQSYVDYTFAFVRNPFDLLVSMFEGSRHIINGIGLQPHHNENEEFGTWLKRVVKEDIGYPGKRSLFFMLFKEDGSSGVNYIGRFEELDKHLYIIADDIGQEYKPWYKINDSARKAYHHYYDNELKELVERTWGQDLEVFGYQFEPVASYKDIDLSNVRYNYLEDRYQL